MNQSQTPRAFTKLLLSGAILTAIVWSGVLLRGCGARVSTTFNVAPQSASSTQTTPDYSKTFALVSTKSDVSSRLRLLTKPRDLRGSLVFISKQKILDSAQETPILQRFDFDKSALRVLELQLPNYETQITNGMSPLFRATKNLCFLRARSSGSDSGEFDLYTLNIKSKKGWLVERSLFDSYLAVSPDGKSCVYQTVTGWARDGSWPWYVRNTNGRKFSLKKVMQASSEFSWTSRNTLLYDSSWSTANPKSNFGYPSVYERDLSGRARILAKGATFPRLNASRRYLAAVVPSWNKKLSPRADEINEMQFDNNNFSDDHIAIAVFDLTTGQKHIVKAAQNKQPELFWTKSQLLYVEHFRDEKQKISLSYVWRYDAKRNRTQLIYHEKNAIAPVKIANDRYLLCREVTNRSQKSHIFAIDLQTQKRLDIFEVPAGQSPLFDWIDG